MRSGSRAGEARLWSGDSIQLLAGVVVFCVVSYPPVALVRIAVWAGISSLLLVAGYVMVTAHLGARAAAQPGDWTEWGMPTLVAVGAGLAVSLVAVLADRVNGWFAAGCGLMVVAEMVFVWLFYPWLVVDAETGSWSRSLSRSVAMLSRSGLGLLMLLSFLTLGVGATWSRGVEWAPSPRYWLIALTFFTLLLMFAERLRFFGRSAREGNLLLAIRAREKWIAAGLLVAIAAALLAAALPWSRPSPEPSALRPGSRMETSPAGPSALETMTQEVAGRAQALARGAASAFAAAPRVFTFLWLLLLLLVVALVLVWVFSRTRAARWVLGVVVGFLEWCLGTWRRLVGWLARAFTRGRGAPPAEVAEGQSLLLADPLFDVFQDQEALSRLSARQIAIHTYHLMLNFAEMLGYGRRSGQTPFEYGGALTQVVPGAEHAIAALTWGYSAAMYGAEDVSLPPASAVRESWRRVSQALAAGMAEEELALRRQAYLAARTVGSRP